MYRGYLLVQWDEHGPTEILLPDGRYVTTMLTLDAAKAMADEYLYGP
jgi:hypothetical protein